VILYIHGFGSSAFSAKVIKLKALNLDPIFLAPSLSTIPDLAMQTLEDIIMMHLSTNSSESLQLMGSSLGGYYALYLSQKYDLKAILINPSIEPYKTLNKFETMTSYYDGSSFEWSKKHIQSLHHFATPKIIYHDRLFLLTQKGDETLDYRVAVKKLKHSKQIIQEGGNHSFENIECLEKEIKDFFHSDLLL
jgi:predicted esterase YcpF (UPF0227 family)